MSTEFRASDNRVTGRRPNKPLKALSRYINNILANQSSYGSNGLLPDLRLIFAKGARW